MIHTILICSFIVTNIIAMLLCIKFFDENLELKYNQYKYFLLCFVLGPVGTLFILALTGLCYLIVITSEPIKKWMSK